MPPKKKVENTVNIIKETLEENINETKKTIKKETKKNLL